MKISQKLSRRNPLGGNHRSRYAQQATPIRHVRLWAIGLSFGCVFSALSSAFSSQAAIAQSSEDTIAAIDAGRSGPTITNLRDECTVTEPVVSSGDIFSLTLLSDAAIAATQTEDPNQRARAFERIGKVYACMGQNEQADNALQQAITAARQIDGDYAQNYRKGVLKDVAKTYGRSINDIEQMNTVLAGLLAAEETPYQYARGSSYSLVRTAARLYTETGQYQQLRELIDRTASDEYRLDLITEVVPTLRRVESTEEQAAIATLFSEFDLNELYSSVPTDEEFEAIATAPPRGFTPSIIYAYSFYDYNPREIGNYSTQEIADFVGEQSQIIEQISEDELEQIKGFRHLGEFLANANQPEAALAIFETILGQTSEIVRAQTNPGIDEQTLMRLRENLRVPIAYAYAQMGNTEDASSTLIGFDDSYPLSLRDQIEPAITFAESEALTLSTEQRLDLIGGAEAILRTREDEEKVSLLVDIANAYAAVGDVQRARQLLPMINEILPTKEGLTESYRLAWAYSRLLVMTGDYEGAIAFVENLQMPSLYVRLPSQFVEAEQYEQAEALLEEIDSIRSYFGAAEYMIAKHPSASGGYEFTARMLKKIETADLAGDESYQKWRDQYPGDRFLAFTENARSETAETLISKYILSLNPGWQELRIEFLTDEEQTAIQQLSGTLDNNWLRAETIRRFFSAEESLRIIDSDADLVAQESLLLRRTVELTRVGEFEQAMEMTERLRSPYIKARALTHIANRYLSNE